MKNIVLVLILCVTGLPVFAQTESTRIVPGAQAQFANLFNTPVMVKPAIAEPLGRNWFRLETDIHIFTDEVNVRQVAAALLDFDSSDRFFSGKKSKLTTKIISREPDGITADFITITIAPLGIQLKTPYRATVKAAENTDTRFALEARQFPDDSVSNKNIKNMLATRYAEEVTINGRKYTYIRMYTVNEVNASILPGAKNTLEKNSFPVNEEAVQMLIAAAKTK